MSALNLGRVGTPIPQKIWDVFLFVSPLTELYWFKECQTKSIKLTPLQADALTIEEENSSCIYSKEGVIVQYGSDKIF